MRAALRVPAAMPAAPALAAFAAPGASAAPAPGSEAELELAG